MGGDDWFTETVSTCIDLPWFVRVRQSAQGHLPEEVSHFSLWLWMVPSPHEHDYQLHVFLYKKSSRVTFQHTDLYLVFKSFHSPLLGLFSTNVMVTLSLNDLKHIFCICSGLVLMIIQCLTFSWIIIWSYDVIAAQINDSMLEWQYVTLKSIVLKILCTGVHWDGHKSNGEWILNFHSSNY